MIFSLPNGLKILVAGRACPTIKDVEGRQAECEEMVISVWMRVRENTKIFSSLKALQPRRILASSLWLLSPSPRR